MPFHIVWGHFTEMKADAIVNDMPTESFRDITGPILLAAGFQFMQDCAGLGTCQTGKVRLTGSYLAPCKWIIHTVGPRWSGGASGEKDLLASCYEESLKLAEENGCESISFPLISSGAKGFPADAALKVASDTILKYLDTHELQVYLAVHEQRESLISRQLQNDLQAFIRETHIVLPPEGQVYSQSTSPIGDELFDGGPLGESLFGGGFGSSYRRRPEVVDDELEMILDTLDEGFRDMLLRKIDEKHISDAECYKNANIDRKLFNKIKNQPDYHPGKATVTALAISLHLPLGEIREMLAKAGFALSRSSIFDVIVEYFITRGNYNIFEINEALFFYDQKLLGSVS